MKLRSLQYSNYEDVITDIQTLRKGYEQGGQWNLEQICKHVNFYLKGSLDGFGFSLPWIIRITLGKSLLKKRLAGSPYASGEQTARQSVYPVEQSSSSDIDESIALLKRLTEHKDSMHPSPLFGELTYDQWKTLHLQHIAHHFSHVKEKNTKVKVLKEKKKGS